MPTDNIAAIDLGSNSFHMIITRVVDGHLQVLDRMKEMVQLAAGLDEEQRLSREARERALDCLARFGQRLRQIPTSQIRVVGTNTLRQARNSRGFLAKAEALLGCPVEVISGIEEARLIYLGVAHSTAAVAGRRLVIDIGGGSTELIAGEGFDPLHLESLYMGCVSMTKRYFDSDRITQTTMEQAILAARLELEPVQSVYEQLGWEVTTGASGTIRSIRDIVQQENWSRDGISRDAMLQLRDALINTSRLDALASRWDLSPERAAVLPGGFAILQGLFEGLNLQLMQVSDGALREGVVYDLLGRIRHEDVRERTIAMLTRRYAIDAAQARRVQETAQTLFEQVRSDWELDEQRFQQVLNWAAGLHELGLGVAHSQYHKHGGYVLRYADLPGFSRSEQQLIAVLVRGHRRKFPVDAFKDLPKRLIEPTRRLCVLLRLAVILHRGHRRQHLPAIQAQARKSKLELSFPDGWLDEHPLTRADLLAEAQLLKKVDFKLSFS